MNTLLFICLINICFACNCISSNCQFFNIYNSSMFTMSILSNNIDYVYVNIYSNDNINFGLMDSYNYLLFNSSQPYNVYPDYTARNFICFNNSGNLNPVNGLYLVIFCPLTSIYGCSGYVDFHVNYSNIHQSFNYYYIIIICCVLLIFAIGIFIFYYYKKKSHKPQEQFDNTYISFMS